MISLECCSCSSKFDGFPPRHTCEKCGGLLEYMYDYERFRNARFVGKFSFWRYRPFMPEVKNVVSMGEGGTPLHRAQRLAKMVESGGLYFKDETRNPTNSFRDRCAALLVSNALDLGYKSIVCATNGNLGASLAAYCAKFGLSCHVVVPKSVDVGKLAQMLIYNAAIEEHGEIVDEALKKAGEIAKETGWYQGSVELNPLAVEALKTIAYEVFEQMGVPEWFIVPMGSGGTLYAIWKGFKEILRLGLIDKIPRMLAVQALGSSPILRAYKSGVYEPFKEPRTIASAIRIGNPVHWRRVLRVIEESRGAVVGVDDSEIIRAHKEIARLEGLGLETSSSTTLAGLKKALEDKVVDRGENAILVATGHALKEPEIIDSYDLELIKVDSVNDLISILSKL
ncbi:MAG: threonine synthase [Acidilobaceae archaeon]